MADPVSNVFGPDQPNAFSRLRLGAKPQAADSNGTPSLTNSSSFSKSSSLPNSSLGTKATKAGTDPSPDAEALVARLAEEMAQSWQQGHCARAEEFLALHPELWKQPEAAVDLIYEEICLRREYGQEMARTEIVRRFPQWQAQLEILLDCHQILEIGSPPAYPGVGESVGDFHLLAKLGQGGHGCVFLATQMSLADRPVVIKLTPLLGHEHLSLARLQHTHIMPLFSVSEDPERNLRTLCMPYFGGGTLARLLTALAAQPLNRRTGQDLVRALDEAQAVAGVDLPSRDPARRFLAQASYVQAICWIGACLADALKYAHERGLVHLDVKPSNVLLTADAQPMLLDFHLAHQVIEPGGQQPTWIGGTPTYMSPEQQIALAELRDQRPISVVVDGRSDLYSLGLLLYEALAGSIPGSPASKIVSGPAPGSQAAPRTRTGVRERGQSVISNGLAPLSNLPRLNQGNPQVAAGLADILAKCLARDPRDRYPDAGALAADLYRHLNDLPLHGVSNRSLSERWRKWRRRRPHALSVLAMVLLVLLVALASGVMVLTYERHHIHQARTAMTEGDSQLRDGRYDEAVSTFARGLSQVENLPGSSQLALELRGQLRRAQRAQAARELHRLADRFRLLYGVDFLLPSVIAEIEAVWERAAELAQSDQSFGSELEQHVRADLLDLAILYTSLRVRGASGNDSAAARREALKVLDQAGRICGDSAVLCYERQRHAEALGLTDMARAAARRRSELPPHSAWEHYALGRALLEGQKLEEADSMLQKAVELEPQGLWPRFYQGICAFRLGRYEDAVLAFTTCAALAPEVAGCLSNRALAYQAWGRSDRALHDYDAALRLDATLGVAALNRGILHCQEKRYSQAYADFERARKSGVDPAAVHYNLALVHLAQEQRAPALACLERALQHQPAHKEARQLYERLQNER